MDFACGDCEQLLKRIDALVPREKIMDFIEGRLTDQILSTGSVDETQNFMTPATE